MHRQRVKQNIPYRSDSSTLLCQESEISFTEKSETLVLGN